MAQSTESTFNFDVAIAAQDGCPAFDGRLGRVNIFLGANGSGKSKLLRRIVHDLRVNYAADWKVIETIGGRKVGIADGAFNSARVVRNGNEELGVDWRSAYLTYRQDEKTIYDIVNPAARFNRALQILAQLLEDEEAAYGQRLKKWADTDQSTPTPTRAKTPIQELLDLFTEVFPGLRITAKCESRAQQSDFRISVQCTQNGCTYPPSQMSDGEQQVLAALVDRYFLQGVPSIVVVDEPELNLDPQLACTYWNIMEREMPDSVFVYATHSLDFVLRDNVDRVWMLGAAGPEEIGRQRLQRLSHDEQRQFLGGIRGILTAEAGVVVEGNDESIDTTFYQWLLKDRVNICVRGYGSCNDVLDGTRRLDVWRDIAPNARIVGVIDRDYKSDTELENIRDSTCIALDLHDVEAYLCHPEVLLALARALNRTNFPTQDKLRKRISEFLKATLHDVVSRRVSRRCYVRRQISIPKQQLRRVSTDAQLIKAAQDAARLDQNNPPLETSVNAVGEIVRKELLRCKQALDDDNLLDILRLARGKDLLDDFAALFGFKNGKVVAEYVSKHLSPDEFPHLKSLRELILERLK